MKLVPLDSFLSLVTEKLALRKCLLALDVGTKRIGVAKSDQSKNFVHPLTTLNRKGLDRKADESVIKVARSLHTIVAEERISGVVVGYPVLPSGAQSPLCIEIEYLIERFRRMGLTVPCTLWDERYSSNKARRLHQTLAGRSQADRKSNSTSLNAKDSVEAAIILQDFIEGDASELYDLKQPLFYP